MIAEHDAGLPADDHGDLAPRAAGVRATANASRGPTTGPGRGTFAEVGANANRLAGALTKLGVRDGDRVGTFMWNSQEHLEAYFAVPSMGAVLHTLNIRLFPEQLAYVINHAEDKVVIVDDSLVPVLAQGRRPSCRRSSSSSSSATAMRRRSVTGDVLRYSRAPRRGGDRLRLARDRRTRSGRDVLHVRHDRQPEGRRVLAPLGVPALAGGDDAERARLVRARSHARRSCRCSTPTRGASRTPRSCAARRS